MDIPHHIGIIMDGNRRWAKQRGLPVLQGHKKGLDTFEKITKHCQKRGVKILTVFAFSTENWKRSKREVDYLIKLFAAILNKKRLDELTKEKVRLNILGQKERLL